MPLVQKEPAVHRSQVELPELGANFPEGQLAQAAREASPSEDPPVPAGHAKHAALEALPELGL